MTRRKYPITECMWLPWSKDCPDGWTECQPLAHHAIYGRIITREIWE